MAASISTTSTVPAPPGASAIQDSHFPQGFDVGPFSQLRDLAMIRAVLVFPQPRGPLNNYA